MMNNIFFSVKNFDMEYKFFPSSAGVVCESKDKYAFAMIDCKGKKRMLAQRQKSWLNFFNVPFLRGIFLFFGGFLSIFSSFDNIVFLQQNLSQEEEKSRKATIILLSAFCGLMIVFWIVVLGLVPSKLAFLVLGYGKSIMLTNFIIALFKTIILFLIFLIIRFLPPMIELYKFNGACNVVEAKSKGIEKRLHNPINFLNFVVFSFLFSSFVITFIAISVHVVLNWIINFAIFGICLSFSYEFLNLLSKSDKWSKVCAATSFLVVVKPNTTHLELSRSAYLELISGKDMNNLKEDEISLSLVKSEMESKLAKYKNAEKSDIEWIIATVLKKNRAEAKLVKSVSEKEYREMIKMTEERAKGKPLSAIFGFVDFYGLRFSVNKKVLSPRMETELLVEVVLKEAKKFNKHKILDVGTGSGAIAVTVAKMSEAEVTAVDISKGALETAMLNAKNHEVKVNFFQSDLLSQLKKKHKYDIIVSNPPYIRSLDIEGLDVEVKNYDPKLALDGGEDGLDFYRRLANETPLHLQKNGKVFFELGKGQFTQVKKLLSEAGFQDIKGIKDYNKIYRIIRGTWKK